MCNVESAADPALPANEIEWRRSAYIYTKCGIGLLLSTTYRCATATFCLRSLVQELE